MKISMKLAICVLALAVVSSLTLSHPAVATSSLTIQGIVYDKKNKVVPGVTVVAWCGDVSHLGGSNATDASGHYLIKTNSDDCPLGTELTVTTDVNGDGLSDGATHTQTHTSTFISIHLGSYTSVVIPEFGAVCASIAALAGVGVIGFVRKPK